MSSKESRGIPKRFPTFSSRWICILTRVSLHYLREPSECWKPVFLFSEARSHDIALADLADLDLTETSLPLSAFGMQEL